MNVLAISLVLTTLVTAGFFKPNSEHNKKEDVLVVEFNKDDGTKVLISPQVQAEIPSKGKPKSGYVTDLKDKLYEKAEEASSILPNIGQGISSPYLNQDQENGHESHTKPSARDVVCDAFGKCREKIATALGKTKDKVSEKAHEAADQVDEVKESAKGTAEKVKDTVTEASDKAKDKVEDIKEKAKAVVDTTKRKKAEVEQDASRKMEHTKGEISEKAKELEEKAQHVKDSVKGSARKQFAVVQSKIYPVYFKAMAYCVGAAFLGHLLSQKRRLYASSAEAVQGFNLLASIAMILVNLLYLEPLATKVMFELLKLEKEEGRGRTDVFNVEPSGRGVDSVLDPKGTKTTTSHTTTTKIPAEKSPENITAVVKPQVVGLSQKLKKLNSYSSFLNVLTLVAPSHHLVHLTQLLDATS
ncbi:hypothetical protein K7X08_025760 [Anisodus acutangulus]|uniref:TMEM205-like domain-containing protein n=1 Tax=Anisodus acutangulus TaxID=402998 RepID=A0A9Q1LBV8_9SOLA|nr:hypothetical protein K7X08_025760 [Anisodus acutangulus]